MGIASIKLGPKSPLAGRQQQLPISPAKVTPLQPAIEFVVPGNPIPWERVQAQTGKGRAIFFTAKRTRDHQALIKNCARVAGVGPLTGPVKLSVVFFRATRQRCDVDNLSKSVQDALNGVAYLDDSQIVGLVAVKLLDREDPRTEVRVSRWPGVEPPPLSLDTRLEDHFDGVHPTEGGKDLSKGAP